MHLTLFAQTAVTPPVKDPDISQISDFEKK
jgi:hypothetical protein